MVDVSNRSRVPAGRREGGRFASEADGPSDGVADISGSGEYDATGVRHFAHRSEAVEAALQSDSPCYLTASGDGFDLASDPTEYRDPIYVPYDQDGDLVTEEIDFGGRPHDGWIVNPDEGMDGDDMRPVRDFLDGKADSLTIRRETTDSVIWGDDEGEDETLDGETIVLASNRPPETAVRESFKQKVNGFDRFEAAKAICDTNATKAELHWAAENADIDVAGRLAVSANAARLDPEESDRLLERVLRSDREAAGLAVQQLNLPEDSKLYLAESPDPALRAAVAKRRDLPKEAEALLMRDPDDHVRAALVPHLGALDMRRLKDDPSPLIREEVARHGLTSFDALSELSHDPNRHVRVVVANNPRTPKENLARIANDGNENISVRLRALANESTPREVIESVTDRKLATARAYALAAKDRGIHYGDAILSLKREDLKPYLPKPSAQPFEPGDGHF